MSFTAEMFPTVSSGAVELPKTFVNSLRILFDILDEDKDGLVPISVIEQRWQGNGISGLPNGVLQSLRQVTPADGMLDFDLFCSALKLTLKTNKEQARNNQNRQPNKAAVRPNNFHPMYGHQHINSAPYLRVNPTLKSDGNGNNNHITTAENQKERSTNVGELIKPSIVSREHASLSRKNDAPHHFPVNRSINQPVERVDPPKSRGNVYPSHGVSARVLSPTRNETHHSRQVSNPPAYTHPHRRNPHGNAPPHDSAEHSKTRSHDEKERHPPHYEGGRNSRPNMMSPPSQRTQNDRAARTLSSSSTKSRPSTSSSSSGVYSPNRAENQQLKSSVVKSPPPYMAHIKPQSQKVVKAQLVYPQNNPHQTHPTYTGPRTAHADPQPHPIGRTPQPHLTETNPQRANRRRRKDEPRRHTLSNGITTDFNALKRMKDLEQERDVLHQGQDLLDRCREWYQDELVQIKEQQHQLITGKEMNGSSRRDQVTFRTSRILEINRQMRALMNSTEAFPEHMNLAIPQRQPAPSDPASPMMDKIKDQNRRLTQEVSFKNDRIASLEKEKAALIRQLFDVRGRSRTRERPEMSTLF